MLGLLSLFACGEPALIVEDPVAPVVETTAPVPAPAAVVFPTTDGERIDVALPGLSVGVTAHRIGEVPVWTFLSKGLPLDQVAITVRRDRDVQPMPLLDFLQSAFDHGHAGAPGLGETHGMDQNGPGFLGRKRFFAMHFVPPSPLAAVPGTETALTAVLFDDAEARVLLQLGPQRVLGRIAARQGDFPVPIINDVDRAVSVVEGESSPLLETPTVYLSSLQVTEVGGGIELALAPQDRDVLSKRGSLKRPGNLRLVGGRSPDLGATAVFDGGKLVTLGDPTSARRGLGGVRVVIGPTQGLSLVEDHAELVLTEADWAPFWEDIVTLEPRTRPLGEGTLHFVRMGWPGWRPTEVRAETPRGAASVLGVELMMSEAQVRERVDPDALRTALGMLEIELVNYVTEHPAPVSTMWVELIYDVDAKVAIVPQWGTEVADEGWWTPLASALAALEVPVVKDRVHLRMQVAFL